MRHGKKLNHLGRTSSHRKAMMANMACSLIMHKRINTTVAKAKALRTYVEPLITKSKNDTTHSRRTVFAYLKQKEAVAALFREIGVKVAMRQGGYTRILKTGTRLGDNAEMCMIELVDFNEFIQDTPTTAPAKKVTRRSRGTKKTADDTATEVTAEATSTPEDTATEEKPKKAPRAKKKDDTKE